MAFQVRQTDFSPNRNVVTIVVTAGGLPARGLTRYLEKRIFSKLPANARAPHLLFDLTGLSVLDSGSLGEMVRVTAEFGVSGQTILVAVTDARLRHLFTVTKLDQLFPVVSSVDAALQRLHS